MTHPFPAPRPAPAPSPPRPTQPTSTGPLTEPDPLQQVRERLDALDETPLHQHPEQFAAIDGLLRSALDASNASGNGAPGPGSAPRA